MPLKVLMLGWEYPPILNGGLGVACHGLAEALGKLVDLRLVLPSEIAEAVKVGDYTGGQRAEITGAYVTGGGLYGDGVIEKVHQYAREVARAAGGWRFDLIHAHDWMTIAAGIALKKQSGRPLVVHIHSLEIDRVANGGSSPVYRIEREGMEQADLVIAVSSYTAALCVENYGIPKGKVAVVHNGVEKLAPQGERRDDLVVFVGRLAWQKGAERFVRVADRVGREFPEVEFALAGDGEMRGEIERMREGLGAKRRKQVRLLGFQGRREVGELLRRATVFCMPSVSEPFGIAALEAGMCGAPVIVSRQSGVREVMGSALLADHWDEAGWCNLVSELLRDKRRRQQVALGCRMEAQMCTWDRAAGSVLAIYREWLEDEKSRF